MKFLPFLQLNNEILTSVSGLLNIQIQISYTQN